MVTLSKRTKKQKPERSTPDAPDQISSKVDSERPFPSPLTLRHLRIGWWSLLLFLTLGIVLEAMHGFKIQWYLGEQNATRRLMFTLAHVHGTLLSLVHLAFAATDHILRPTSTRQEAGRQPVRSLLLSLATILIPLGFFAGGWKVYDGDPSLGILLVPLGAVCLFAAVLLQAIAGLSR